MSNSRNPVDGQAMIHREATPEAEALQQNEEVPPPEPTFTPTNGPPPSPLRNFTAINRDWAVRNPVIIPSLTQRRERSELRAAPQQWEISSHDDDNHNGSSKKVKGAKKSQVNLVEDWNYEGSGSGGELDLGMIKGAGKKRKGDEIDGDDDDNAPAKKKRKDTHTITTSAPSAIDNLSSYAWLSVPQLPPAVIATSAPSAADNLSFYAVARVSVPQLPPAAITASPSAQVSITPNAAVVARVSVPQLPPAVITASASPHNSITPDGAVVTPRSSEERSGSQSQIQQRHEPERTSGHAAVEGEDEFHADEKLATQQSLSDPEQDDKKYAAGSRSPPRKQFAVLNIGEKEYGFSTPDIAARAIEHPVLGNVDHSRFYISLLRNNGPLKGTTKNSRYTRIENFDWNSAGCIEHLKLWRVQIFRRAHFVKRVESRNQWTAAEAEVLRQLVAKDMKTVESHESLNWDTIASDRNDRLRGHSAQKGDLYARTINSKGWDVDGKPRETMVENAEGSIKIGRSQKIRVKEPFAYQDRTSTAIFTAAHRLQSVIDEMMRTVKPAPRNRTARKARPRIVYDSNQDFSHSASSSTWLRAQEGKVIYKSMRKQLNPSTIAFGATLGRGGIKKGDHRPAPAFRDLGLRQDPETRNPPPVKDDHGIVGNQRIMDDPANFEENNAAAIARLTKLLQMYRDRFGKDAMRGG